MFVVIARSVATNAILVSSMTAGYDSLSLRSQ